MLAEKGIRVNAVARTELDTAHSLDTSCREGRELRKRRTARAGRAAGRARLAFRLLASDEARYISGAVIPATGGRPML